VSRRARRRITASCGAIFSILGSLLSGQATPADTLKYFAKEPTRFVILRRDASGTPVTSEQPANMVFPHGNAFERQGKLVVDSILPGWGEPVPVGSVR